MFETPTYPKNREHPITSLNIRPVFEYPLSSERIDDHILLIERTLLEIIPEEELYKSPKEITAWMKNAIPFIKWTDCRSTPDCLTIYILSYPIKEVKSQNFFIDLLKRWLIFDKEIDIVSQWNMYFHMPDDIDTVYFVSEVTLMIESGQDLITIQANLPLVAKEIISGAYSWKYAKYILETKNLLYDRKISLTNQDLIRVLHKRPNDFDSTIFSEINRFLAVTDESFRAQRPYRHITRLACSLFLLRKTLRRSLTSFPEKRHLFIRFVPTVLKFTFGSKPVLGLVIGLNLFDQHEFFNEKHIISGIQKFISNAQAVKTSFYSYPEPKENIRTIYLEIEKKDGSKFTLKEIQTLKQHLQDELKGHIEHLIPAIFVIRNEEETMRNILILSQELKYVHDLPQVIVSFDYQSIQDLTFTIVLVRICKSNILSIEKLFEQFDPTLNITIERVQTIGYLRKKYPKEANVFRIKIEKNPSLLRKDSSVNLFLARKKIISILTKAIGEIRDFNGGMILKQGEAFSLLKKMCANISSTEQDLLENFFYSINPIETQTRLPINTLHLFFNLLLKQLKYDLSKKESYLLDFHEDKKQIFVMIRSIDPEMKEEILKGLNKEDSFFVSTFINYRSTYSLGIIYQFETQEKKEAFIQKIDEGIKTWLEKVNSYQKLRIYSLNNPISLDPRIGGDEDSKILLKLLFEGLMRIDKKGNPQLAVAKSVKISKDLKEYRFTLKQCCWSNGSKIIAYDFEYAWKKILSPSFTTPFAFVFYPIKYAREAKQGIVSLDKVGIKAIDESTLVVELEHPAPYFLELTTISLFSPINHANDKIHPNWATQERDAYICNGPFKLERANDLQGYRLKKNPLYWNAKQITLKEISIIKSNPKTAIEMFKNGELDGISIPVSEWETSFAQSKNQLLENENPLQPFNLFQVVACFVFNVERFPFHHKKIRQALALCINRAELLKKIDSKGSPAYTPLVESQLLNNPLDLVQENIKKAQELFFSGLKDLHIEIKNFPVITLLYLNEKRKEQIAKFLKDTWKEVLGIDCRIEGYEWKTLFRKLEKGDYQISSLACTSVIKDPIYTLNWFRYKKDKINLSNWESVAYQETLNQADRQTDPQKRLSILKKAEEMLLDEMPILPLFYDNYAYFFKEHIKNKTKKIL